MDDLHRARAAAYDDARPEAVAKVHARGHMTARERIGAMTDPGSFVEFGLLAETPGMPGAADGLVNGVAEIDGSFVVIASYDYSVYGGTQTGINHGKLDRMIDLAYDNRWPFICFADGGGARAQNMAGAGSGFSRGLTGRFGTFDGMAALSGWVPTVAIVAGRSFAGNASIAGFSDVVIATRGSAIGMGGPPLVEAALGLKLTPEELGPSEMHERVGGIDLLVDNEATAIDVGKQYLSYFRGDVTAGEPSQTADAISAIVPQNRRRAYDMRRIVEAIADADSVLELRPNWAKAAITALIRLGGTPAGVIANQPLSEIGGAIDSDTSDKIARFVQLCDAFDLPIVSLVDNPGFMLGPEAERAGIARHHARTIMAHFHRTVPLYSVQIRKAYGLGPSGMGAGTSTHSDVRLAWPTAESGGMGLEGAASLVRRDEIRSAGDASEARAIRDDFANEVRERSSGLAAGRRYSFDDIIAPEETRDRLIALMRFARRPPPRDRKKHYIDTW